MSMSGFFKAFTQEYIEEMLENNDLIENILEDMFVEEKKVIISTDVATTWDVLRRILDGTGFESGEFIEDVISFGALIISAQDVKIEASNLSKFTIKEVLNGLQAIDDDEDIYHLQPCKEDNGDYLLMNFKNLIKFYKEASEKDLGAIFYIA